MTGGSVVGVDSDALVSVSYTHLPPIPADYPLLSAKNTLLTPHQAFISEESMVRRAKIVFDNVYAYLDGAPVNVCK